MKPKPKHLHVGLYVFRKDGHLIEITGDDMPELPYESIIGIAEPHEDPKYSLRNLQLDDVAGLDMDNFFSHVRRQCPYSYALFDAWLKPYYNLFLGGDYRNFFNLPYDMQVGVLIHFFMTAVPCRLYLQFMDWKKRSDFISRVVNAFADIQVEHYNENLNHQ